MDKIVKKLSKIVLSGKQNNELKKISMQIDNLNKEIGRVNGKINRILGINQLQQHEFKVYSQWGEDGIIQFIVERIPHIKKIFIEFGVQDYTESNTRFLLQNENWSGLVIDSSEQNIDHIKNDPIYWRYNLKAECSFITKDNINDIIRSNGIEGDVGLLSIDIDGNDYWVWGAIDCIRPAIVICEYNSLFGCKRKLVVPYRTDFERNKAHFSNVYYGASIAALHSLASKKGYSLIGSNSNGNNLFFILNEYSCGFNVYRPEEAYVKAQFRESRESNGNLNFSSFEDNVRIISEIPLYDVDLENMTYICGDDFII